MPTNRRRTLRSCNRRLGPDAEWYLCSGVDLDGAPPPCPLEKDPRAARELWERHKAELMESYRRKGWAGHRPWAYWMFEHGLERTQMLHGKEEWYLREHNLLEAWEIEQLNQRRPKNGDETD